MRWFKKKKPLVLRPCYGCICGCVKFKQLGAVEDACFCLECGTAYCIGINVANPVAVWRSEE